MKSIKSFQNVIKPTSRKFSNSVIFEKYNQMAKIMKFLIFSLFFATSVGKEIVGKSPEFVFNTQTECINGDFFYSPNVSVKRNIFQVIARMEFIYQMESQHSTLTSKIIWQLSFRLASTHLASTATQIHQNLKKQTWILYLSFMDATEL